MISIIICHRNSTYLNKITDNIKNTIGTSYELIVIDNSSNQYNIFQAYNIGVSKSKYDVICFSHEDIIFHTKGWGINVLKHFENDEVGLIGICGGNAMPVCPAPWWNNKIINDHLVNNINTWPGESSWHDYKNPFNENSVPAVLVDGAWFCIKKGLFDLIKFDDLNFNGFHCYDSDICLQIIQQHKKVFIVYDILLEHFSAGVINKDWIVSAEILADKWAANTPLFAKEVEINKIPLYNYECLLTYCYWLQSLKYSDRMIQDKIKKYLSRIKPKKPLYHTALLLSLWHLTGYGIARYLYFPINTLKKTK